AHHGIEDHQAQACRRILRRNGWRDHPLRYGAGRDTGQHNAHDYRCHYRRGKHASPLCRTLGCCPAHRLGLGSDHPGICGRGDARLLADSPVQPSSLRLASGTLLKSLLKSMSLAPQFCDVETALEEIRAGRMIVVIDDEDRENEGDLTMAAEKISPDAINFMAKFGRGLVCLAMTEERLDYLRLGQMSSENTSNFGTAFTESIDAKDGVTTGISAYDRAQTIRVAIDPSSRPNDLARPGHVFPLRARKGGVLVRAGQTEASVDLARLAGLVPAGVICEI